LKCLSIPLAGFLLTACASSPKLPPVVYQPIPITLRVIPQATLPVPKNDSMGALVTAYIDVAEIYHSYRKDAIALDTAITNREACDAGK
jgi:hypothetical protein